MHHTLRLDPREPGQNSEQHLWVMWDPRPAGEASDGGLALAWRLALDRGSARLGVVAIGAQWAEIEWDDTGDHLVLRREGDERPEPLVWMSLNLRDGRVTPESASEAADELARRLANRITGPWMDVLSDLDFCIRCGEGPHMAESLPGRISEPSAFIAWSEAARSARPDEYVLADGSRIAVELNFCPNPDCSCKLFSIQFFIWHPDRLPIFIGAAEASYADPEATPEITFTPPGNPRQVRAAWAAFRDRYTDLRYFKLFAEQLKEWARPLLRMLTRGRRVTPRASRNAPCPCGSGQKYKKCCWATDTAATVAAIPR